MELATYIGMEFVNKNDEVVTLMSYSEETDQATFKEGSGKLYRSTLRQHMLLEDWQFQKRFEMETW